MMENKHKYHNGSTVYWYDSYGEMQYGKIYSMREYRGTADVVRSNQMFNHSEVELKSLWPTEKECIDAKRDELTESITDVRELVDLMLKHGRWEGMGEVVKEVAEKKMEEMYGEREDGYKIYAGDIPLTVSISDPGRTDTAYNLLCAMVENGTAFSVDGKPVDITSSSDLHVISNDGTPYEPKLDAEWFGNAVDVADGQDAFHVCGWDEDFTPIPLTPDVADIHKVHEMYNCLTYGIDPSVSVYAEGESLIDLENLNIMNADDSYAIDSQPEPDWARASADDFTNAVESLQNNNMEL